MTKSLRIAFMGTPDFAAVSLRALLSGPHEIICVYSQPPRPKGRGQKIQKSPVHELAQTHNIPVHTPESLKNTEEQEIFKAYNLDVAVVAAYGLILPQAILDAPRYGCLNIHGSILPRWRGASPIQRAIWAGDEKSGITIMQMDKGLDTGDMIAVEEIILGPEMTSTKLHDALAEIGARLCKDVLSRLVKNGKLEAEKQDDTLATYAHLLRKEDGLINWNQNAVQIDRQIRALNPWPGVYCERSDGSRLKILNAALSNHQSDAPAGTILDRHGHVTCGDGDVLHILRLKPEGKQAMDFTGALNGGYVMMGQKLCNDSIKSL